MVDNNFDNHLIKINSTESLYQLDAPVLLCFETIQLI